MRGRSVFLVLANLDGLRDGRAHPSLRYLARLLCCSEGSVRAAIRELEAEGLLTRHAEYGAGEWEGGRQKSNLYRLADRPRRTVSADRTNRTARAADAAGTVGADGAVGTGPLPQDEPAPCTTLHPSEDPKREGQERSDSAAEVLPPDWAELQQAFGPARCQAILGLVRSVRPPRDVLAEGVGRLLRRRPDNPAGYLAVMLRGITACAAEPPAEVAVDPARELARRAPELERLAQEAFARGDLEAQARHQREREEVLRQLRRAVIANGQRGAAA